MSQVEPAASDKRRMLSPKYRAWLLFWSLVRLVIVLPIWLFGIVALIVGVALSPWGTGVLLSQGEQRDFSPTRIMKAACSTISSSKISSYS